MPWTRTANGVGGSGRDPAVPSGDLDQVDGLEVAATAIPPWRREPMPVPHGDARDRVVGWVVASRSPLVAGALCLGVVGVLVVNALVPMPVSAQASPRAHEALIDRSVPPSRGTPARENRPGGGSGWSASVGTHLVLVVPGVAGVSPAGPDVDGRSRAGRDVGAAGVRDVSAVANVPGVGASAVSIVALPPSSGSVALAARFAVAPVVPERRVAAVVSAPVVAAPVAPLTAAQQTAANALAAANLTAANALAAANLTKANALAAANLTAANAAAAAAETAGVAAAAAEATRLQALADAYAVAHPGG